MGRRELPFAVGGTGSGLARRVALLGQGGAGATSVARRLLLAYHPLAAAACPVDGPLQVIDCSGEDDLLETVARLRGVHAAAVVLDATRPSHGHAAFAAQLLGTPRIVVALNKMDLVGYAREPFERARDALERLAAASGLPAPRLVPVSAHDGELITASGGRVPWYRGPTLAQALLDK
jgi:translation elongation factor EF-1alpha